MFQVLGLVLPLFSLILLGYISGRWKKIPVEGLAWLNYFIVYVSLPALFFQLLSKTPLQQFAQGQFLLYTTGAALLIFVLCFALAKLRRHDTATATIQALGGTYGNIGYLGPPLALAAFGAEVGVPVALIFCVENALYFTLAPLLMALQSRGETQWASTLWHILRSIFTHPFIVATLVSITAAWAQWQPPSALEKLLASLAASAAPAALFAMGVTAALRPLKRVPFEAFYLLPIKLLLHPLLVYALLSPIPELPQSWLLSAVLMASLPTATNVFVLAQQYNCWEQRASSIVVLSTLVSTVSVTAILIWAVAQL
ncbi:MAG: AEC family transporter [Granulosicoccaceae bacterium]